MRWTHAGRYGTRRQAIASAATALAVVWLVACGASAAASTRAPVAGFRADGVTCATGLPQLAAALYCASRAVGASRYDGRGVVRLAANGRVGFRAAGNDLLLAIDGALPRSPRPRLRSGGSWAARGYRCTYDRAALRCVAAGHGFTLSRTRLARF